MTVAAVESSIIIKKPLLKRRKYYIKAKNNECASCKSDGKFGCCRSFICFEKRDFQMDFTSEDDVRDLLSTDVICISLTITPEAEYNESRARIYVKQREEKKFGGLCVFWSEIGCKLPRATRPSVCRRYRCYRLKEVVECNKSALKLTFRRSRNLCFNRFSKQEVKTIARVLLEVERNNRCVSEMEYKNLDWDYILSVL